MKHIYKRATALLLTLAMLPPIPVAASYALGDEIHIAQVALSPTANYYHQSLWSNTYKDLRTERYVTYSPQDGVQPMVVYGNTLVNRSTLSEMARSLENQGYRVLAGTNGDFFDTATGNTLGVVVSDGIYRSSSGGFDAIGFHADGSAFIGTPVLTTTATFHGYTLNITDVNKTRTGLSDTGKMGGYYLYTSDYSATTQHTSAGVDVILTPIAQGDIPVATEAVPVEPPTSLEELPEGVEAHIDPAETPVPSADPAPEEMPEEVPEEVPEEAPEEIPDEAQNSPMAVSDEEPDPTPVVQENIQLKVGTRVTCVVEEVLQSTTSIPIPEGKFVLTINNDNNQWLIDELASLQPGETVELDINDKDGNWSEVTTALGGLYRIVTDGQPGPAGDKSPNPRTAIGVKADGSLVLYTIDGRQPGYSIGATMSQVAQRLIELGCVDAIGLDGGGSTMMGTTMPWDNSLDLINKPSDGGQRSVTNGIFLVSSLKPTGIPNHLTVQPYDTMVLGGAQVSLSAQMVDSSYYPMPFTSDMLWSVQNGDGLIDGKGVYTASNQPGINTVAATAMTQDVSGQTTVTVIDNPDTIRIYDQNTYTPITALTVTPGAEISLTATATYRNLNLISQDECYVWTAEPSVGTFDQWGTLTVGEASGSGNITVSAGTTSVQIPVNIVGHITNLDHFEGTQGDFSLVGTNTMTIAPETRSDYVALGHQSARLDYDASGGSATAISTLSIPKDERFLSLWVYGDGSGNSLTLTLSDSQGETSTALLGALDFTGWKRLIAPLPDDTTALLSLNIIYTGTATTGTLWVDHIMVSNEDKVDTTAPTVKLTVEKGTATATVTDNYDTKLPQSALSLTIDGKPHPFNWQSSTNTLSVTLDISDSSLHRVTLTATDQSGNIGSASQAVIPSAYTNPDLETPTNPFLDMEGHWAYYYTTYLYEQGISNGVASGGDYLFQPEQSITRGEFALMIARWMGLNPADYTDVELPFADLDQIPTWALDGVKTMYALGIMKGSQSGDALYALARDSLTRAEAMTLLGRIQAKGYSHPPLTFDDASAVPAWALPYVETLVSQGIISGYENRLNPGNPVKRCEVAKMLYSMR